MPGTRLTEPRVPASLPPMRRPRREQFDPARHPWLHCTSRCVRKAFLCGGKDGRYDHRRQWVEDRLQLLAGAFAVEVASYAVMSNHFHVVLRMLPGTVGAWSATEVVRRWWTAYPPSSLPDGTPVLPPEATIQARAQDAVWVGERRKRLGELQWFMKTLKEGISRRANREDEVTGTFWQARFHSVVLLDQAALVACMAYVDLNPIRAKMADRPERSAHTAVRQRIRARQRHRTATRIRERLRGPAAERALAKAGVAEVLPRHAEDGAWVAPLARCVAGGRACSVDDYLTLVDRTGRWLRAGKRGAIPAELAPILARLDLRVDDWIATMAGWRQFLGVAVGHHAGRVLDAAARGLVRVRHTCALFVRGRDDAAA